MGASRHDSVSGLARLLTGPAISGSQTKLVASERRSGNTSPMALGGWVVGFGLVALALAAAPSTAAADANYSFFAGTSRGAGAQLLPRVDTTGCLDCFSSQGSMRPADDRRLATLGFGLVGREGRARGGAELFTIFGFGEQETTGFTAVTTYAGLDGGRIFGHVGLGVGSYWGMDRAGTLAALAGTARAEIGIRVHHQWMVLGRSDLIVNSISVSPVVTLGLQWVPDARR